MNTNTNGVSAMSAELGLLPIGTRIVFTKTLTLGVRDNEPAAH